MAARDTHVELAPESPSKRPTAGVPTVTEPADVEANVETIVERTVARALREGVAAAVEELRQPLPGKGGGGADRWARAGVGLLLLIWVGSGFVHEMRTSRFERALLGLIDVLSEHHPEQRGALKDVERDLTTHR